LGISSAKFDTRPVDNHKNIIPLSLWDNPHVALAGIARELRLLVENLSAARPIENEPPPVTDLTHDASPIEEPDKPGPPSAPIPERSLSQKSCKPAVIRGRLYRGVGVGTYWHAIDARLTGFTARNPALPPSASAMIAHIARASPLTPFVSLVRSYAVPEAYARDAGRQFPSKEVPAFVHEVDISESDEIWLIDPLVILSCQLSQLETPYHTGNQDLLQGILNPVIYGANLVNPSGAPMMMSRPRISPELEALVRVLRDTEVLAVGNVPPSVILSRYPVF
jgi:hypothetical protein